MAGLLQIAALFPRDRYELILTDENIEPIDFDLKCDLVCISAMTSYVKRGYEIADSFRSKGIPVIMGGVHPTFMTRQILAEDDAIDYIIGGEGELPLHDFLKNFHPSCKEW